MERRGFTITVEHAQRRYGQPDDASRSDVLTAVVEGEGVYFKSNRESVYRWGCSRTYPLPMQSALRRFMEENGQTLLTSKAEECS